MPSRPLLAVVALALGASPALSAPVRPPARAAAAPVSTRDVDRFWVAYDAVTATQDPAAQAALFQRLYVDPASPALRAFMQARGYTVPGYLDAIRGYPRFWRSVRPRTLRAASGAADLSRDLARFRQLYPALKPATVTYVVGALRSNGTTSGRQVIIGTEIAAADASVDVSELPPAMGRRLSIYFATDPLKDAGFLNVHEYVHTQQRESAEVLLARVVYEGVAEYVAELVRGANPKSLPLYGYGAAHEAEVKARFREEMLGARWDDWLYNSTSRFGVSDMGYYVGYRIAQDYYARQRDKTAALRTMIELDYGDLATVQAFVAQSGYLDR